MLRSYAVPFIRDLMGEDFIFQRDNCGVHIANVTLEFLDEVGVQVLQWPAKSPDLNIMENVWALICNKLYDGPHFKTVRDLEQKIKETVTCINLHETDELKALYGSMPRHISSVLCAKGGKTKYLFVSPSVSDLVCGTKTFVAFFE